MLEGVEIPREKSRVSKVKVKFSPLDCQVFQFHVRLGWSLLLFGLTNLRPSYQSMDTCSLLNGLVKMALDFTGSVPELIPW